MKILLTIILITILIPLAPLLLPLLAPYAIYYIFLRNEFGDTMDTPQKSKSSVSS